MSQSSIRVATGAYFALGITPFLLVPAAFIGVPAQVACVLAIAASAMLVAVSAVAHRQDNVATVCGAVAFALGFVMMMSIHAPVGLKLVLGGIAAFSAGQVAHARSSLALRIVGGVTTLIAILGFVVMLDGDMFGATVAYLMSTVGLAATSILGSLRLRALDDDAFLDAQDRQTIWD